MKTRREKLTDQAIRALTPPEAGQAMVWDTLVRRFGVRVAAGGAKTFVVQYKRRRATRRAMLGHFPAVTLADARTAAKRLISQVEQGQDPAAERRADRKAMTFNELALEYIEKYAKLRKRSWSADERHLRVDVLPVLGRRVAKDIARREVRDLVEDIAKRAPVHANRVLVLVKKVLTVGVDRELLAANVAAGLARPTREQPRTKVLTSEEVRAIFAALATESQDVQDYVRLRFLTATRGIELLAARWSDVDLDARVLTIRPEVSKTGKPVRVPLVDSAVSVLRRRHEAQGSSSFVFPTARPTTSQAGRRTGIQEVYKRLRRRSGVSFVGHDPRRFCASTLAGLGVPHEVIARALGHQVPGITAKHYAVEGYAPAVRHALERLARHLDAILAQAEPAKVVPLRA